MDPNIRSRSAQTAGGRGLDAFRRTGSRPRTALSVVSGILGARLEAAELANTAILPNLAFSLSVGGGSTAVAVDIPPPCT